MKYINEHRKQTSNGINDIARKVLTTLWEVRFSVYQGITSHEDIDIKYCLSKPDLRTWCLCVWIVNALEVGATS